MKVAASMYHDDLAQRHLLFTHVCLTTFEQQYANLFF
jgi:hypothetical protein